jgi:hypothetical protein
VRYNVQLTNENTSVVSSVFDVITLDGSGTDILATKGDVALQAVTSFASPQFDQLGTEIPNGQYRVKIASKPAYITLAGGLVSGSTVPVVSDIARIGDITAWSTPRENTTAQIVYEVNLENGRSLISQIDSCKGFPTPDGLTKTWQLTPSPICEFNLETGEKTQIGYGVVIKDEILDCLTEVQKQEIILLQGNINLCSWEPIIVSGGTSNYFDQFFSGNTTE